MSDATETYTQCPPNGTGNKIRNLAITALQPDGTLAVVQMQVVSVVDADGRAVDPSGETNALLTAMLGEMRALRRMYGRATGQSFVGLDTFHNDTVTE